MGASPSKDGIQTNERVERYLREEKLRRDAKINVLLLGTGDSGKSTIVKQMRMINRSSFTSTEIEMYRQLVFDNLVQGMRFVLEALPDLEIEIEERNLVYVPLINTAPELRDGEPFPYQYLAPLKALWADEGIQTAIRRGNEVSLPDNLTYFFSELDRLFGPAYRPTDQDILNCRQCSTGVTETVLRLQKHELHLIDIASQKSERRKWIHVFQDVTSILFLVSLAGYDQTLVEDQDANQMQDAMTIWDSTCHSQWFKDTSLILFFTKLDLFEEKIQHSNIKATFPDYDGKPNNLMEGREYFRKRFLRLAQKKKPNQAKGGREIYIHFMNATDTSILRVFFAAIEEYVFLFTVPLISIPLSLLPNHLHS